MIRYEALSNTVGLVRFYQEETADTFAPYCAVCTIIFTVPNRAAIEIKGMCGVITLANLVLMAQWLHCIGVLRVTADRVGGKRLPLFKHDGDRQVTLTSDWVARFGVS